MQTIRRAITPTLAALVGTVLAPLAARAALPDAGLYTMFTLSSDYTSMNLIVCGYLPASDGCYGSGNVGPFGHIGAVVSGTPMVVGNVVTRAIWVVDVAAGAKGNEVVLARYKLTNTVTNGASDVVELVKTNTIPLPLVGGANAHCSLAATSGYVWVGTDQSTFGVRVAKQGFAVESILGFSNNPTVSSITTDDRGYVIVAFGTGTAGGTVVFGPNGNYEGDGGGATFVVPTAQGLSTADLPTD